MSISSKQLDTLSEIVNIGFGRAAATLSALVGQRVLLEAPLVELYSIQEVYNILGNIISDKQSIIHQSFYGSFSGDVLIFLKVSHAIALVDMLSGNDLSPRELEEEDREALLEVGNIVINAYIGTFSNMLKTQVTFSLPDLKDLSFTEAFHALPNKKEENENDQAIVVKTVFHFKENSLSGYVVLIISGSSFDDLIASLPQFD